MRKLIYILILAAAFTACEKSQDLNCLVTLNVEIDGQDAPISVAADHSLAGTMFRNINTLENYTIPVIAGGTTQMQVLKGIYMIAFDADAILADGSSRRVRSSQYSSPEKAVNLTDNNCSVTLKLIVLQ